MSQNALLYLLFYAWLKQNTTIFPYHELHINTWTIKLYFSASLTVFLPTCLSALCSQDDKHAILHWSVFWSVGLQEGQRSASELRAGILGFSVMLKDPSAGKKSTEPSSLVFVLYLLLIILPLMCLWLAGEQIAAHLFVKHTINIFDSTWLERPTVQINSGAEVCRPLVINRTWGHWLPWKLYSILIIKNWQRLQQRKS